MDNSKPERNGHLVIIGGSEDRTDDRVILQKFVELSGGPQASILVITAASAVPEKVWPPYDDAFRALGVTDRALLHLDTREQAEAPDNARSITEASGIFIAGGDQKRLMATLGGSAVAAAMHASLATGGACIGGTSAGASALSVHMLAEGNTDLNPEKGAVSLGDGLGLLRHVVIDQHFSERQRLARLLSIVAQHPELLGIGIDEDTALVIEPGTGVEVIGNGAVTLVDGRDVVSNAAGAKQGESLELINVRLHLLPAGTRYRRASESADPADSAVAPGGLRFFVDVVTQTAA